MNNSECRSRVIAMYEAFGRGDIDSVIAGVADNVHWEYAHADCDVPWLQPRFGKAGARAFFNELARLEFLKFEPKVVLSQGNLVVSVVSVRIRMPETGLVIDEPEEVHLFHFNEDGLVERFCHRLDSHAHWLALHAA